MTKYRGQKVSEIVFAKIIASFIMIGYLSIMFEPFIFEVMGLNSQKYGCLQAKYFQISVQNYGIDPPPTQHSNIQEIVLEKTTPFKIWETGSVVMHA